MSLQQKNFGIDVFVVRDGDNIVLVDLTKTTFMFSNQNSSPFFARGELKYKLMETKWIQFPEEVKVGDLLFVRLYLKTDDGYRDPFIFPPNKIEVGPFSSPEPYDR